LIAGKKILFNILFKFSAQACAENGRRGRQHLSGEH
jgi:hypothetical protein